MPLPPVDSIVNVYETTVPCRSETTRWVVDWRGCDDRRAGAAGAALVVVGVAGRDRAVAAFVGDQRTALAGEAVGEQAGERHVEEVRVGHVGVAVGEREARGLEEEVQGAVRSAARSL